MDGDFELMKGLEWAKRQGFIEKIGHEDGEDIWQITEAGRTHLAQIDAQTSPTSHKEQDHA